MLINAALAFTLICSPTPPDHPEDFAYMRTVVCQEAISLECMDPLEAGYRFLNNEDFPSDLRQIRQRYQDLEDAPRVADAARFPTRYVISDCLSFNRRYADHIKARQDLELYNSAYLNEVQIENQQLYAIWDLARDAQCDYYYVAVRRTALKKLRDRIGYGAYYGGNLPPCVPIWFFQEIPK